MQAPRGIAPSSTTRRQPARKRYVLRAVGYEPVLDAISVILDRIDAERASATVARADQRAS
jgi:hypothetical protein